MAIFNRKLLVYQRVSNYHTKLSSQVNKKTARPPDSPSGLPRPKLDKSKFPSPVVAERRMEKSWGHHGITSIYLSICVLYIYTHIIPVVPHKAVAEVSKIGNYRRGELLRCMDGRANPLMDRKVVVIFEVVAVVTSPTTAGCSVV